MIPLEETGPLGPLLPAHLSEFVVGIVLFVVIILVVRQVVVPRFETMYAERSDAIRGEMERAEQAQAEANQTLEEYRERLAGVEDEAAAIRESAKATATQVQAELRAQAEEEAGRIVNNARVQVEAERSQVMDSLRKDVGSMATTLAGKILGESLEDDKRVAKTVDTFLANLETESAKR